MIHMFEDILGTINCPWNELPDFLQEIILIFLEDNNYFR